MLTAAQMALVANINRDPKRRQRAYEPAEFMPQWSRPATRAQDPSEMEAIARAITAAHTKPEGGTSRGESRRPGRQPAR